MVINSKKELKKKSSYKKVICFMLILSILINGTGCANNTEQVKETIKNEMIQYAKARYNKTFEVVDFEYSIHRDNRRDTLLLKDENGVKFPVYHYTDDKDFSELYDNYAGATVDKLFCDNFKNITGISKYNYYAITGLYLGEKSLYYEDVCGLTLEEVLSKYKLTSIGLVIELSTNNKSLSEEIEDIYKCYSKLLSFDSTHMYFEVIKPTEKDSELKSYLLNIRDEFEDDLSSFKSVKEYIFTMEKNLSIEELKKMIVEL